MTGLPTRARRDTRAKTSTGIMVFLLSTGALALLLEALNAASTHSTAEMQRPAVTCLPKNPHPIHVAAPGPEKELIVASSDSVEMVPVAAFCGPYAPKSVVATQHGHVYAQNMMYRHNVAVFDEVTHELVVTISDSITLAKYGYPEYTRTVRGAPVEAAVSPDGRYVYVSQYSMYGPGFAHPGDDIMGADDEVDPSFIYRIDTSSFAVDQAIRVGAVPKYLIVTPDNRYVLVANWASFTLSVVDASIGREVRVVYVGRHPRGLAVDADSKTAYVAVMGGTDIARVDLEDFSVSWIRGVGPLPRHLLLSPDNRFLYVTLNGAGVVVKIDLATHLTVGRAATGNQPRSMAISADGRALYIVNYESNTVSKVRTADMVELQEIPVGKHPIGVTYVNSLREIWVSCYSGGFHIFRDPER